MDSKVIWKSYDDYTRLFSNNSRKLAFAAGVIAWAFRSSTGTFAPLVEWAWVFIIAFFGADLLQYFVAAIVLREWMRTQERKRIAEGKSIDGEYEMPGWLDCPAFSCLWVKFVSLVIAFICLGVHIFSFATNNSWP
jgi:hypothetical protein